MKEIVSRKITLSGIRPIMFDRYAGDNDTSLPPEQMMYFAEDGKTLAIPSQNILGMMASNFYKCATKIKYGKGHSEKSDGVQGFVDIDPMLVPLMKEGKPIVFSGFNGQIYVDHSVARIKKTAQQIIPNPKHRPVLNLPWSMTLQVSVLPNNVIDMAAVCELLEIGGLYVGVGTWRGRYGKFVVDNVE